MDIKIQKRKVPVYWRAVQLLISATNKQAFLDKKWIGLLMKITPAKYKRSLALRLLATSPHYFIYQWSDIYSTALKRREILELEFERNEKSRQEIFDKLLHGYLKPGMCVVDFGCGPGYIAKKTSAVVREVLAIDNSIGVITSAEQLNGADNLNYIKISNNELKMISDNSIDFIYTIAVFQHLTDTQFTEFFKEFKRILKPEGMVLCHLPLANGAQVEPKENNKLTNKIKKSVTKYITLNYSTRSTDHVMNLVTSARFGNVKILPINEIARIHDDVGRQHLLTCNK